ncbi:hypothetical protein [Labrenzia sp. DG1229]|uniref:hypothetical protein n=1 Tax=Labrenzia sp. DG1229 TaxID=681847 RepID=UPI00049111B3|nr:hypothetical protein [Labrenzia sp. DG1229]
MKVTYYLLLFSKADDEVEVLPSEPSIATIVIKVTAPIAKKKKATIKSDIRNTETLPDKQNTLRI